MERKTKIVKKAWAPEEDLRLAELVQVHGTANWYVQDPNAAPNSMAAS